MKGNILNLRVFAVCLLSAVNTECLRCWHCIAENCAEEPSDNYKASEKLCSPAQFCQKVYFEMVEDSDDGNAVHKSTIRGCSTDCVERNDFENCTEQLKTSRGCVHKHCCNDGDLCNSAIDTLKSSKEWFYSVISLLCLLKLISQSN